MMKSRKVVSIGLAIGFLLLTLLGCSIGIPSTQEPGTFEATNTTTSTMAVVVATSLPASTAVTSGVLDEQIILLDTPVLSRTYIVDATSLELVVQKSGYNIKTGVEYPLDSRQVLLHMGGETFEYTLPEEMPFPYAFIYSKTALQGTDGVWCYIHLLVFVDEGQTMAAPVTIYKDDVEKTDPAVHLQSTDLES